MNFLNPENVSTDDEMGRIMKDKVLNEFCDGYVLVAEERTCMPSTYLRISEIVKNFQVQNDDIWVITYPKAGTTWIQEMVWMIANNLDYERGKEVLFERFPFLEFSGMTDLNKVYKIVKNHLDYEFNSVHVAAVQKNPRFIKTHLPYSLLPDQIKNGNKSPKIVYVMRNPKDVCVSLCHHGNLLQGWRLDVESCAKLFMSNRVMYGSYWKHLFGYWQLRNSSNILFLRYEDMKSDLPLVIKKVANFLEKELSNEEINILTKHLSFESMKNNPATNAEHFVEPLRKNNLVFDKNATFLRAGKVGKYKEELSSETIKQFDAWIMENVAGTDIEKEYNFSV